jgi:hypothetical protein
MTPFVLLGTLFFSDAYAAEVTSMFNIVAIAILTGRLVVRWSWPLALAVGLLVLLAYHIRYMMIVLPLLFVVVSLRLNDPSPALRLRLGTLALTSLLAIFISDWLLVRLLSRHSDLKQSETSRYVQISMLCTLRCDAELFTTRCDTPENRRLIETSTCTEFVHRLKPTGNPTIPYTDGLAALMIRAGPRQVVKWLLLAPLVYLRDIHQLELGPVDFHSMPNAIALFPEAFNYYDRYFAHSHGAKYSKPFRALADILNWLYFWRAYHVLVAAATVASLWNLVWTRDPAAQFLSAYAVGAYLVFAYLNPSAPLRYLLQVITPAYCAFLLIALGSMRQSTTAESAT